MLDKSINKVILDNGQHRCYDIDTCEKMELRNVKGSGYVKIYDKDGISTYVSKPIDNNDVKEACERCVSTWVKTDKRIIEDGIRGYAAKIEKERLKEKVKVTGEILGYFEYFFKNKNIQSSNGGWINKDIKNDITEDTKDEIWNFYSFLTETLMVKADTLEKYMNKIRNLLPTIIK